MKSIAKSRISLARRRTEIAAGDYTNFSDADLIEETLNIHSVLAASGDFGRVAELGIRRLVIERLGLIDDEHRRRLRQAVA